MYGIGKNLGSNSICALQHELSWFICPGSCVCFQQTPLPWHKVLCHSHGVALKQQTSGNCFDCFPILCWASQHHASSHSSSLLLLWLLLSLLLGCDTRMCRCRSLASPGNFQPSSSGSHKDPHTTALGKAQLILKKSPIDNFFWQLLKVSDFLTGFFPFCL